MCVQRDEDSKGGAAFGMRGFLGDRCLVCGEAVGSLWLGQKLGNLLTALFISAVAYCLPALLSLSGMKNGIEWLGFYPLFHAAALWQNQGYNANGESYNAMWIPIFLVCAAFFLAWAIGQALIDDYDMIGVPDEVL